VTNGTRAVDVDYDDCRKLLPIPTRTVKSMKKLSNVACCLHGHSKNNIGTKKANKAYTSDICLNK